jgi:hypothetical protein
MLAVFGEGFDEECENLTVGKIQSSSKRGDMQPVCKGQPSNLYSASQPVKLWGCHLVYALMLSKYAGYNARSQLDRPLQRTSYSSPPRFQNLFVHMHLTARP